MFVINNLINKFPEEELATLVLKNKRIVAELKLLRDVDGSTMHEAVVKLIKIYKSCLFSKMFEHSQVETIGIILTASYLAQLK